MDPTMEDDLLTGGGGLVNEPLRMVAVPVGKPTSTRNQPIQHGPQRKYRSHLFSL